MMYPKVNTKYYDLKEAVADVYGSNASFRIEDVNNKWMHNESPWNKDGDWKMRYFRLYSDKRSTLLKKEEDKERPHRISFLSAESTPYTNLLRKMRGGLVEPSPGEIPAKSTSLLAPQSEIYSSNNVSKNHQSVAAGEHSLSSSKPPANRRLGDNPCADISFCRNNILLYNNATCMRCNDLGGHDVKLLNMVREQNRQTEIESEDKMLDLPNADADEDDAASEICMHGLSMRMTERSVSRSRVSRISTRRDMDITSILAFQTSNTPAPATIPAFVNTAGPEQEQIPRWSIRRSVCPVCSQKWKDRSSIINVKSSGLKRNSSLDIPSVKASAKLRSSITLGYNPKPKLVAVDEDEGVVPGGFRSTSASWQLTRARRFRIPKPQMPPPEATNPPSATAPLARKNLDLRVNRFLSNEI